jgi:hypothetical protein
MNSEALRNIRTMRHVKTSLDITGSKKAKTTNSLSRTRQEIEQTESIADRRTGQILAKERARYAAYGASVEKSRQRLLKFREKLAALINRNRALMKLRHELQQSRRQNIDEAPPVTPSAKRKTSKHSGFREIELKY